MAVTIPKTAGLTDGQIDALECILGCTLPPSIRAFARQHDGARPQPNQFAVPGNQSGVRRFVSLVDAAKLRETIHGFPPSGVPIAEDDCGNYVWVKPQNGQVFFWDHEVDGDGDLIAENFNAFIEAVRPFQPPSTLLQPGQVKRAWINPNFKPKFD